MATMATKITCAKGSHAMTLTGRLEEMRAKGVICDFMVKVEGESFSVHRTVLAACSDYFQALFSHDTKEAQEGIVEMKDVEADAVKQCIDFIYTGEFSVTIDTVHHLVYTSTLLQLDDVTELCLKFIMENLTIENCLFFRTFAQTYSCKELKIASESLAVNNFKDIITTNGFSDLIQSELIHFIKESGMNDKEIWKALITWIGNSAEKKPLLFDLMQSLNIGNFSVEFLISTAWTEALVQESPNCRALVIEQLFSKVEKKSITLNNWFSLKNIALSCEHSNANVVNGYVDNFLRNNFKDVVQTDDFKSLDEEDFLKLLQSSDPGFFHESDRWNAVVHWVKHDQSRKELFSKLFKCIKLNRLPARFIKETVRTEPMVNKSIKCKDLLLDTLCDRSLRASNMAIAVLDRAYGKINVLCLSSKEWFVVKDVKKADFMRIVSLDGELYLLSNKNLLRLNKDGTWIIKAGMRKTPGVWAQVVASSNYIYVVDKDKMASYNPSENLWTENLPGCNLEFPSIAGDGDFIIAIYLQNVVKYESSTMCWSAMVAPTHYRALAAGTAYKNNFYMLGGLKTERAVERYDMTKNRWTEVANMRFKHRGFSSCVADNKLYAVGGALDEDGNERVRTDLIEVYDEKSDQWKVACEMEKVPGHVSACAISLPI